MALSPLRLIYGHDPICGWCYAGIPAMRELARRYPDLPIELAMGGPFIGERVTPYAEKLGHVTRGFAAIKAKTGRHGSPAFFRMVVDPDTGNFHSTPPVHALLQMRLYTPERLPEYAHALQEAHYEEGRAFSDPRVFNQVARKLGLPDINGEAAANATDGDPLVAREFRRARAMGIVNYPTSIIMDAHDRELGRIEGIYDPGQFVTVFEELALIAEPA